MAAARSSLVIPLVSHEVTMLHFTDLSLRLHTWSAIRERRGLTMITKLGSTHSFRIQVGRQTKQSFPLASITNRCSSFSVMLSRCSILRVWESHSEKDGTLDGFSYCNLREPLAVMWRNNNTDMHENSWFNRILVKIIHMCKQCIPGLRFPPLQITKAWGWG